MTAVATPGVLATTTARWRLSRGIRLTRALCVGEQLHRAALSCAERVYGRDAVPWVLSGHNLPPGTEHEHAFYLPEDADGDGWIDHVVVHADAGLEPRAIEALGLLTHVVAADLGDFWAGGGRMARRGGMLLDTAHWWVSVTPYIPPWHRESVEDQLRRECSLRGLPEPRLEELPGATTASGLLPPAAFLHSRSRLQDPAAPVDVAASAAVSPRRPPWSSLPGWFLALQFPRPVAGPLALGYGCHFGLGLFRPVDSL